MDFFHIYNRGVDKRKTFLHASDYLRFTQNLFIYNTIESYPHNDWSIALRLKQKPSEQLVTIHAYCLMQNHYHLLLSPVQEHGIPLFMQKVNMGYSKYFNERYERSGALWQGKYKSVTITDDAQFLYIPYYIHLNALDRSLPKWRKGLIEDTNKALSLLESYRWSSHQAFMKKPETTLTSSLVNNSFFVNELTTKEYISQINKIISSPELAEQSTLTEWR